jgi:hypothetical protein
MHSTHTMTTGLSLQHPCVVLAVDQQNDEARSASIYDMTTAYELRERVQSAKSISEQPGGCRQFLYLHPEQHAALHRGKKKPRDPIFRKPRRSQWWGPALNQHLVPGTQPPRIKNFLVSANSLEDPQRGTVVRKKLQVRVVGIGAVMLF